MTVYGTFGSSKPDHDLVFGCTDDNAGRLVLSGPHTVKAVGEPLALRPGRDSALARGPAE